MVVRRRHRGRPMRRTRTPRPRVPTARELALLEVLGGAVVEALEAGGMAMGDDWEIVRAQVYGRARRRFLREFRRSPYRPEAT
jgi:hypothetical protein